jgi:hypothetical protein
MNTEIIIQTENYLTPNPTFEFIELCQLACECIEGTVKPSEVMAKAEQLVTPISFINFHCRNEYGKPDFYFQYGFFTETKHHTFNSHPRLVYNPTISAYGK